MDRKVTFLPAVAVSPEVRQLVDDAAEKSGVSRGAIIRQAVVFFLSPADSSTITEFRKAIRDEFRAIVGGGDKQQRGM